MQIRFSLQSPVQPIGSPILSPTQKFEIKDSRAWLLVATPKGVHPEPTTEAPQPVQRPLSQHF